MREALLGWLEFVEKASDVTCRLESAWGTPRQWDLIREYYAGLEPFLLQGKRFDPYFLGAKLTPIEFDVWSEIRYYGLPFYPQYPVGRRFVDFGDPAKRIAIEVDGAAYHSPEKDAAREIELYKAGWTVHRIMGKDAYWRGDNLKPVLPAYGKENYPSYGQEDECQTDG